LIWRQIKSIRNSLNDLPVSAKVVLVSSDNKILVLRKDKGIPDLPGGKVEQGEDLFEALERELEEEVGIEAGGFEFVASWVKHHPVLGPRLVLVFETQLAKKAGDVKFTLSEEHVWGQFLDTEGVKEITDLQPGYLNALQICFSRYAQV